MLKLKKTNRTNNSISVLDFKGNVRGEFACENNKCHMNLFNEGIPERYRTANFEVFKGIAICKDSQTATICMNELANMFFLSYKPEYIESHIGWNMCAGFTVSDVVTFFDTPMNFDQRKVQYMGEARNVFNSIAQMGKKGRKLIICLRSVLDFFRQMVMYEEFEKIFGEKPFDEFGLKCICIEDENAGEDLVISWWWEEDRK